MWFSPSVADRQSGLSPSSHSDRLDLAAGKQGHSSASVQLALLGRVQALLPEKTSVLLVGDTEFEDGALQKRCGTWDGAMSCAKSHPIEFRSMEHGSRSAPWSSDQELPIGWKGAS